MACIIDTSTNYACKGARARVNLGLHDLLYTRKRQHLFFKQSVDAREQVLHALVHDLHTTLASIYAREY